MTERNFEHVRKIRIPDEEAPAWMQTLREGGFTDDEIDMIMVHCNATYFELKKPKLVEEEVEKIKESFLKGYGKALSEGEIEYIRKAIEQQLDERAS
ncbi:MAG: hypothetical protein NUV61_04390 [Candidatus Azambacteria bacterium]|nr:hypothetical protein [Candidatus Azambacteria bacterium]